MTYNTGTYSRVTAILSFYDEPLDQLAEMVSSLSGVCDHLVAVDGAYMLYPGAKPSSDPSQMRLIHDICVGLRIGVTMHVPSEVWGGNEVQKRNHTLALAEAVTDEGGWYITLDGDCIVRSVAFDWFTQLDRIKAEGWGVIDVGVRNVQNTPGVTVSSEYGPHRMMYRALRGMQYGPAHWIMAAPDPGNGELITFWGPREYEPISGYDGTHLLKVDHVKTMRSAERDLAARQYYNRRDQLGIERLYTSGSDPGTSNT